MADLQEKRAVAKAVAALHAFGAADAELLVNTILIIRVLHVPRPLDGRRRAKLVLRRRRQLVGFRREKPRAKLAVAAHRVGVDAFDGRLLQHALGGAIAAVQAFRRVNLPHPRRPVLRVASVPAATPSPVMVSSRAPLRRNCPAASPARSIEVWGPCVSGCRVASSFALHHPHLAGHNVQNVNPPVRIHRRRPIRRGDLNRSNRCRRARFPGTIPLPPPPTQTRRPRCKSSRAGCPSRTSRSAPALNMARPMGLQQPQNPWVGTASAFPQTASKSPSKV